MASSGSSPASAETDPGPAPGTPIVADRPLTPAPTARAARLTGVALAVLRAVWPVAAIPDVVGRRLRLPPGTTLVTRAADVRTVIARDQDFTIAEVNAARIERAAGPFILGFDRGEQFDRELAALQDAAGPQDAPTIERLVRELAAERLDTALASGSFDLVRDYTKPVALGLTARYLGIAGPDPVTMAAWMRHLFEYTFLADDARATALADHDAPLLGAHLDALMAERRDARAHGAEPATVLDRLLAAQGPDRPWWDDEAVRRNISGLIVGAVDTTSKAASHVLLELLARPEQLADARAAARRGDLDRLRQHVHESLRFRPHQPVVVRRCRATTRVGRHRIPAGRTVLAVTLSARFDHREVDHPSAYRTDRALEGDLTFGAGLHECFGRFVNHLSLPLLVGGIVALDGVAHAGPVLYDGPFPERFPVTCTPGQVRPAILAPDTETPGSS